jgi:hypothetical protein
VLLDLLADLGFVRESTMASRRRRSRSDHAGQSIMPNRLSRITTSAAV